MLRSIRRGLFPALVLLGLLVSFVQPMAGQTAPPDRHEGLPTEPASSHQGRDTTVVPSWQPAGLPEPANDPEEPPAEIEEALLDALAEDATSNLVVVMAEQADLSAAFDIHDWSARGHYVYDTLRQVAARSQGPVVDYAEKHGLVYHSFLSANAVFINAGDLMAAQELASLPGVALIRLPKAAHIEPTADGSPPSPDAYGWNLDTLDPSSSQYGMQAAQVWNQYGVRGEGIVVANIDTGAYYQHEALDRQYRGNLAGSIGGPYNHNYNWYLPTSGCGDGTYPCDNDGHGSGTIGLMAGGTEDLAEQIGVAPAAQWIACKGCESSSCSELALTRCADWMVAPCPIGVDPGAPSCDPDKRPHIVNNSWGGGGCDTWYQGYILAWVASGIFPAFSAGNSSAPCSSLGSPGDNPLAFGTAAHSSSGANLYADGPSCFYSDPRCDPEAHEVDPHLNAPTYGRTADNYPGGYYDLSGTSGASPHTAGAVALIWSGNPGYMGQIADTFTILEQSANPDAPSGSCGQPACATGNVPNYEYGWGYLDALAAVEMAGVGGQGTLDGAVTEAGPPQAPGDPLVDISITAERVGGGGKSTTTDALGYYTMTLMHGTYTVTAEGPMHAAASALGVAIFTDTHTTQDFQLLPRGRLFGYVTDADNGFPLEATVTVEGTDPVLTDPATGYYEIYLDAGTYNVTAEAPDYASQSVSPTLPWGEEVQHDFALLAAISVIPSPLEKTLLLGGVGTTQVTIQNNLASPYDFTLYEIPGGFTPSRGQGLTPTGSGGPDPFGYAYIDSNEPGGPAMEWIEISATGQNLILSDDSHAYFPIAQSVNFYGTEYASMAVGSNGGVYFQDAYLGYTNECLPSGAMPAFIVPFWDDLNPGSGGAVYYEFLNYKGLDVHVIEWKDVPRYPNYGAATFEVIIFPTGSILFQYRDVYFENASYDQGASATVGIQGDAMANYLEYSCNSPALDDGQAICFVYPGSPGCIFGADVAWLATSIVSGTVPAGGTLGFAARFSARPAAGAYQPGEYDAGLLVTGDPSKGVPVIMTVQPPEDWGKLQGTVTSLGYCDSNPAPLDGAEVLIEDGTTVSLAAGADGAYSTWLEQGTYTVTVSAGEHPTDRAVVIIFPEVPTLQDFHLRWLQPCVSVEPAAISALLDPGGRTTLPLSISNSGAGDLNFELQERDRGYQPPLLDTGAFKESQLLEPPEAQAVGTDVPWLFEDPISGTVPADGGLVSIDVTLDSTYAMLGGEHYATLNIDSDGPVMGDHAVPVTMTVLSLPPGVASFEPNGGSGRVGQWVSFTTTYTDPNSYEDIEWAFFFLVRELSIASGDLAAAYYRPANALRLGGGGSCQPGQWRFPHTDYATLSCRHTTVSGEGDTLTISWVMRPERCFVGGCGEHIAYGYVLDRAKLWDFADSGTWTLYPASSQARDVGSVARPTRLQMERLRKEIEAWRSGLGEP